MRISPLQIGQVSKLRNLAIFQVKIIAERYILSDRGGSRKFAKVFDGFPDEAVMPRGTVCLGEEWRKNLFYQGRYLNRRDL